MVLNQFKSSKVELRIPLQFSQAVFNCKSTTPQPAQQPSGILLVLNVLLNGEDNTVLLIIWNTNNVCQIIL